MDNKTKYIISGKASYERKKAEHRCPRCGSIVKSGIYCADCNSKRVEESRKRRIMLKEQGRCVRCGKTARPGKTMCFNCALIQAEKMSKYYRSQYYQSHKEQFHEYYLKRKERMKSECQKEPAGTVNG